MIKADPPEEQTSGSWLARLLRRLGGGGKRSKGVRPGDRFGKVGEVFEGTQTIWRVWGISDFVEMTHIKLIQEEPPHRIVTVSLSTLLDKRFYRRLAPAIDERLPDHPAGSAAGTNADDSVGSASIHGQPEAAPELERTTDVPPREDVIRFVGPEGRAGDGSRTNPFSKARSAKRRAANKTSGVTH